MSPFDRVHMVWLMQQWHQRLLYGSEDDHGFLLFFYQISNVQIPPIASSVIFNSAKVRDMFIAFTDVLVSDFFIPRLFIILSLSLSLSLPLTHLHTDN